MRIPFLFLLCCRLWGADTTLLVLQKGGNSLGFFTADGNLLGTAAAGRHPHEMVLSSDGRFAYTTDNGVMRIEHAGPGGNTVSIVDLSARRKAGEISTGGFRRPHGIDIDRRTGRLAVTCEQPDQLLILDPARRKIIRAFDTRGRAARMVTFGKDGRRAYVGNSSSATVAAIHVESGEAILIPTGERPEGSVLSRDGKLLYVCHREASKIAIIDTEKNAPAGEISTGKGPVRIALAPDGRTLVYAAMHDRAVEIADTVTRKVIGRIGVEGSRSRSSFRPMAGGPTPRPNRRVRCL